MGRILVNVMSPNTNSRGKSMSIKKRVDQKACRCNDAAPNICARIQLQNVFIVTLNGFFNTGVISF
jgi:hypothetical protein